MKYIYATKYKEKTRYRIVVTNSKKRINLGYANTLEEAIKIRNNFLGAQGSEVKQRINLIKALTETCLKRYDFLMNEKEYQLLQQIKKLLETV